MKKVILSALVAGMFMFGTVYAQTATTPAAGKPVTTQQTPGGAKTDKPAKTHKKGKGKKKAAKAAKAETKPADQK
jgi:hypothetical protein